MVCGGVSQVTFCIVPYFSPMRNQVGINSIARPQVFSSTLMLSLAVLAPVSASWWTLCFSRLKTPPRTQNIYLREYSRSVSQTRVPLMQRTLYFRSLLLGKLEKKTDAWGEVIPDTYYNCHLPFCGSGKYSDVEMSECLPLCFPVKFLTTLHVLVTGYSIIPSSCHPKVHLWDQWKGRQGGSGERDVWRGVCWKRPEQPSSHRHQGDSWEGQHVRETFLVTRQY